MCRLISQLSPIESLVDVTARYTLQNLAVLGATNENLRPTNEQISINVAPEAFKSGVGVPSLHQSRLGVAVPLEAWLTG